MFGAILNLFYPQPEISKPLRVSPIVFPYPLHVAALYGAILTAIVIFALTFVASEIRDDIEDRADDVYQAAQDLRNQNITNGNSLANSLDNLGDDMYDLALAMYISMMTGAITGGVITCLHFPLLYFGWIKMVLETRYGVRPRPKFSEVGLFNKNLFVGNFVSSILLELILVYLIVLILVFFISFEPTRDWLLSLWELYVSILVGVVFVTLMRIAYDTFFLDGDVPRHVGGIGFTDIPFMGASVPYSTLASLMRLLYVLGFMFVSLPRFDVTLLPEGIRTFDTAWTSFTSLHRFEMCGTVLMELAGEAFMESISEEAKEGTTQKFRRVRNRWRLYSILALNPSLIQYLAQDLNLSLSKISRESARKSLKAEN